MKKGAGEECSTEIFSVTRINLFALVESLSVLSVFTCLSVSYLRRSVSGSLKMKGEEMCVFFQTIQQYDIDLRCLHGNNFLLSCRLCSQQESCSRRYTIANPNADTFVTFGGSLNDKCRFTIVQASPPTNLVGSCQ